MKRDTRLYIEDILDSIAMIEEYTQALSEADFLRNTQVQDAVIRRLEIIGEAVKNIPGTVRSKYSEIPWQRIAGLRDVLIHAYFGVQLHRTWRAVQEDLPRLKAQIAQVRDDLAGENTI